MALPLEFHETFEAGTKGNFDSESDTGNRLDFPHQRDLGGMMPWRGAYLCRVDLGKNSTDAYLEKAVSWATGQTRWGRLKLFIGEDVQFGNNLDHVRIKQWYSGTKEAFICLGRIDPEGIVLGCAEEDGGVTWYDNSYIPVTAGHWITLEWYRFVHGTTGVVGVLIPHVAFAKCDQGPEAANTKFRLGAIDQSGDMAGHIYFDDVMVDEARLYDDPSAHNGALSGGSLFFLQSGFAFLGEGAVDHVTVIDAGSNDCRVRIYDTDEPTALPAGSLRYDLRAPGASRTEQSNSNLVPFKRGAYVQLSGTNPQAIVRLGKVASDRYAV